MPTYEYALSITSQFYFCGIPFRLDPSPKCALNCLYCFAMSRGGRRTSDSLLVNGTAVSEKIRRSLLGTPGRYDVSGEMIARRTPIHLGGISDPFSSPPTTAVTSQLLETLSSFGYPTIISTKRVAELLNSRTLDMLSQGSFVVQVSFSTSNDCLASIVEPFAPPPSERLEVCSQLAKAGIPVIARLQPVFLPWIDELVSSLIPKLSEAGCRHTMVELLKLPVEKNLSLVKDMLQAVGWDACSDYRHLGAVSVGREWMIPAETKWRILQPIVKAIHESNMTYGAADYGLTHLGDTDCCCGIDNVPGFENWFRGNFSNIVRTSPFGSLSFDIVRQHWAPAKPIGRFMNSHSRLQTGNSVLDYLQSKWNRPGTSNSPDSFLGVVWRGQRDRDENCIYEKHEQLVVSPRP